MYSSIFAHLSFYILTLLPLPPDLRRESLLFAGFARESLPDSRDHLSKPPNIQDLENDVSTHVQDNEPHWQRPVSPKHHQFVIGVHL
jgi:hypothetical protein